METPLSIYQIVKVLVITNWVIGVLCFVVILNIWGGEVKEIDNCTCHLMHGDGKCRGECSERDMEKCLPPNAWGGEELEKGNNFTIPRSCMGTDLLVLY